MSTTWHASPDVLARFATAPEALDDVTASSVEQHLVRCESCRGAVAQAADVGRLSASWDSIADVIDRPHPMLAERALTRVGLSGQLARLVGATAGLRLAWLITVGALAAAAALASQQEGADAAFLVAAPLVPLAAVLVTFLPLGDPAGEAGTATPMHGAGLALRRVVAALVPTFLVLAVAGRAVPDLAGGGAAWALPGLALAVGSLALATYIRATVASASLAVVWTLALIAARVAEGRRVSMADTAVFESTGQVVALMLAAAAAAVVYARRDRFATLEVTW